MLEFALQTFFVLSSAELFSRNAERTLRRAQSIVSSFFSEHKLHECYVIQFCI